MTTTAADEQPTQQLPIEPPADTAPTPAPEPAPEADPLPAPRKGRVRKPRATPDKDKPAATRSRAPRRAPALNIADRVAEMYTGLGMGVAMIPSGQAAGALGEAGLTVTGAVGLAIAENAKPAGDAWAKLADENPQVRAALERVLTVSAFGSLFAAHLPILIVAGTATGYIPPAVAALLGQQGGEQA